MVKTSEESGVAGKEEMMEKIEWANREKTINRMKGLNDRRKAYKKKIDEIDSKKQAIYQSVSDGFKVLDGNSLCPSLREKLLQNEEIKAIIKKYHIQVKDIALISDGRDYFHWPPPWSMDWSTEEFERAFNFNSLQSHRHYFYGGPENNLKVSFHDCHNGRYVLAGYQFKFPEKQKRDWKATFKGGRQHNGLDRSERR